MSKLPIYAYAGISILISTVALANQSPITGGPIGATDINNAFLPAQGEVFLGLTGLSAFSSRLVNNDYNYVPGSSHALLAAVYVGYVYPFSVLGGKLSSGLQEGYEADGRLMLPGLRDQTVVGWRDLYVDFANWSRYVGPIFGESTAQHGGGPPVPYGLTVKFEYSMIFAIGQYNNGAPLSPSAGTTFFIPNAGATYLTQPDRLGGPFEVDLHFFYDARSENPHNDYTNGSIVDLDYAAVQRFHRYSFGITGSYAVQVEDDLVGPYRHEQLVSPEGDHYGIFTLGPIFSAPIPFLNGSFKIKAPFAIRARNTLLLNTVVANLLFQF